MEEDAKKKTWEAVDLYVKEIAPLMTKKLQALGMTVASCPRDKQAPGPRLDFSIYGASVEHSAAGLWKVDLQIASTLAEPARAQFMWRGSFKTGNKLNFFFSPDSANVEAFVDNVIAEMQKAGWVRKS